MDIWITCIPAWISYGQSIDKSWKRKKHLFHNLPTTFPTSFSTLSYKTGSPHTHTFYDFCKSHISSNNTLCTIPWHQYKGMLYLRSHMQWMLCISVLLAIPVVTDWNIWYIFNKKNWKYPVFFFTYTHITHPKTFPNHWQQHKKKTFQQGKSFLFYYFASTIRQLSPFSNVSVYSAYSVTFATWSRYFTNTCALIWSFSL